MSGASDTKLWIAEIVSDVIAGIFPTAMEMSAAELEELPVLGTGQFDNRVIDQDGVRVFLSRMTVEDGMPYENQITVERWEDGWNTVAQYQG